MDNVLTLSPDYRGRRRFPRKSVLLCGRLYRGREVVDCVITNISANGARIMLDDPPQGGSLGALSINRCGMFPAAVVWQDKTEMGVRFLDAPEIVIGLMKAALPHCRLEYEIAAS